MKKKFSHFVEVEDDNGGKSKLSIYKAGNNTYIQNENGYEHLMHSGRNNIHQEITVAFSVKVIGDVWPNTKIK